MGAFGAGLQEGAARRDYREQQSDALKQQQRNIIAAGYLNAIQTELPPSTVKDAQGNQVKNPAYDEALQKREDLLKKYVAEVGPEQHASFGQRLHGLIFGEPKPAKPVHGNAPQPAPAPAGGPPAASGASQPQSSHAYAHNPVYAKIQEGLDALGNRLKGFAHPLPPQPETDWASMAAAMTPEQRKSAQDVELERMKEEAALEREQILAGSRNLSTPEKQFLSRWAVSHGATDFESLPSDQQEAAIGEWHRSAANPIFKVNPATGLMSRVTYAPDGTPTMTPVLDANGHPFGGFKPDQVRIVNGHYHYIDQVTGKVYDVPVTTETKTIFGPNVPTESTPPVSSQAPQLPPPLARVNAKIATANAASPKLHKKQKPRSATAPQYGQGRVIGHTASLMDKSDIQQYTKVAEDANMKQEAYDSARKGLQHPTASSDQQLVYQWVRSNVQGSGRMTQAEFQQAKGIGSWPLRIQTAYYRAKTGRLPPELEQELLADIKRAADTAQAEAQALRNKAIGSAPVSAPSWDSLPPAGPQ